MITAVGAALLLAAVAALGNETGSEQLARSLRRQLMEDNYDYVTVGSGEGGEGGEGERHRDTTDTHGTGDTAAVHGGQEVEEQVAGRLKGSRRSYSTGKSLYTNKDKARRKLSRKLARRRKKFKKYKSILGKDIAERYRSRYRYKPGDGDTSLADDAGSPGSLVHYRVLQVSNGHRRSGRRGGAALIQEEGPRGVALVKLGGGPFPELRLSTDDPLPPAPAAPHDHTHTPLDEQENSVQLAVTPDDILVL